VVVASDLLAALRFRALGAIKDKNGYEGEPEEPEEPAATREQSDELWVLCIPM
jgi:hypothetical protein